MQANVITAKPRLSGPGVLVLQRAKPRLAGPGMLYHCFFARAFARSPRSLQQRYKSSPQLSPSPCEVQGPENECATPVPKLMRGKQAGGRNCVLKAAAAPQVLGSYGTVGTLLYKRAAQLCTTQNGLTALCTTKSKWRQEQAAAARGPARPNVVRGPPRHRIIQT